MNQREIGFLGFEYDPSSAHLVRAFLPGVKVVEEQREEYVACEIRREEGWFEATVTLCLEGKTLQLKDRAEDRDITRQNKNLIKRTLYRGLQQITGLQMPWGILVGIRPTKLLREMEEEGLDQESTKKRLKEEYLLTDEKLELACHTYEHEKQVLASIDPNGVSLYVSIPFCPSRCHYCSFVSHSIESMKKLIPDYLTMLLDEIRVTGEQLKKANRPITSVYIGGGTPTVLEARDLKRITDALRENFDWTGVQEFSVECGRPDTITREKLQVLKNAGVDRISINPQTMNDATLERIGRKHRSSQIIEAFQLARSMGFDNINMDLIAGLEGEEPEDFAHTLDCILPLAPENITLHTLSLKKGAEIGHRQQSIEAGRRVEKMLNLAYARFTQEGYAPYYLYRQKNMAGNFENVSYCKDQRYGIYNVLIMQEVQSILAMGAGAVSKLVGEGRIQRIANPKYPYEYIDRRKKGIIPPLEI